MKKDWQTDLEYVALVEDLLAMEEVQWLAEYTQHHYSTRLEHSIAVSYLSYRVAKKIGGDLRSIARAGLLHDLFYYDWRTENYTGGSHAYVHPRVAVENAEKITELNDKERDIIIKHMWLATIALPKYKESYIVTMVDKYCAISEVFIPTRKKVKKRMTALLSTAS